MAPRSLKPFFVVLALLAATSIALSTSVDVNLVDQPGIRVIFPEQLGDWKGDAILFCQAKECQGQYFASEVTNLTTCGKCGGKLGGLSKVETDLLPPDTEGLKQRYRNSAGRTVMASIVLSGKERASIHRPEVCLRGQGSDISHTEIITVPLAGRAPLKVKVIELAHERAAQAGAKETYGTYYAYWFAGKGRETPEHWQRMTWMATDRIFHNVAHRWAYIAVAGLRIEGKKDYQDEIRDIVAKLHPAITLN